MQSSSVRLPIPKPPFFLFLQHEAEKGTPIAGPDAGSRWQSLRPEEQAPYLEAHKNAIKEYNKHCEEHGGSPIQLEPSEEIRPPPNLKPILSPPKATRVATKKASIFGRIAQTLKRCCACKRDNARKPKSGLVASPLESPKQPGEPSEGPSLPATEVARRTGTFEEEVANSAKFRSTPASVVLEPGSTRRQAVLQAQEQESAILPRKRQSAVLTRELIKSEAQGAKTTPHRLSQIVAPGRFGTGTGQGIKSGSMRTEAEGSAETRRDPLNYRMRNQRESHQQNVVASLKKEFRRFEDTLTQSIKRELSESIAGSGKPPESQLTPPPKRSKVTQCSEVQTEPPPPQFPLPKPDEGEQPAPGPIKSAQKSPMQTMQDIPSESNKSQLPSVPVPANPTARIEAAVNSATLLPFSSTGDPSLRPPAPLPLGDQQKKEPSPANFRGEKELSEIVRQTRSGTVYSPTKPAPLTTFTEKMGTDQQAPASTSQPAARNELEPRKLEEPFPSLKQGPGIGPHVSPPSGDRQLGEQSFVSPLLAVPQIATPTILKSDLPSFSNRPETPLSNLLNPSATHTPAMTPEPSRRPESDQQPPSPLLFLPAPTMPAPTSASPSSMFENLSPPLPTGPLFGAPSHPPAHSPATNPSTVCCLFPCE